MAVENDTQSTSPELDSLSESLNTTKKAAEIGLEPVTAYVPTAETRRQKKRTSADRMRAKREREAAEGIRPLSMKARDQHRELIERLAKASEQGEREFQQQIEQLVQPQPQPQSQPQAPVVDVSKLAVIDGIPKVFVGVAAGVGFVFGVAVGLMF